MVSFRKSEQDAGSSYQYQNLTSQNEFRLLKLLPGNRERLDCELHHYTLGSGRCPQYRAVSYTWGNDPARQSLHLSGNVMIRVRKNLKAALRSIRDPISPCWLWIDAICINQTSDREKGHQVRLMADIYGNANVVLAWLQSAGENTDVAKAFRFVQAAANFDDTEHSVYNYCQSKLNAHGQDLGADWRSVLKLCRLRYWSRKWIIQELVLARTVVLQLGTSPLPMADFEIFCGQLNANRDVEGYLDVRNGAVWKSVLASAAARLALQRSEGRGGDPRSSYLHDLVVRYQNNECRRPCDHVYALYSLVGPQRTHLTIEYEDSDVKRLVDILNFVQLHERLHPSKILSLTRLLLSLFHTRPEEFLQDPHKRGIAQSLNLVVPVTMLGSVELQQESAEAVASRKSVGVLSPTPTFEFDTSRRPLAFVSEGPQEDAVGRQDMIYFNVTDTDIYGLAACRLQNGDAIWRFRGTKYAYAVRHLPDERAQIVGRAHLFTDTELDGVRHREHEVSLDLATLLQLNLLAVSSPRDRTSHSNMGGRFEQLQAMLVDAKVVGRGRYNVFVLITSMLILCLFVGILIEYGT
ncbi:hypothetical protein B0A48_03624 [Cryoendolithus antarcticus]|uniref:Heterokaryon incompatibility domain-containing protein n=1 Tax=Cryoendolithus antarcticus TaxID=1507870 RepID=A0A1V8TKJ6_9PEZI|nr:hypothetical protein B0A48_03624 [Cryoendolithus antarcticus]